MNIFISGMCGRWLISVRMVVNQIRAKPLQHICHISAWIYACSQMLRLDNINFDQTMVVHCHIREGVGGIKTEKK